VAACDQVAAYLDPDQRPQLQQCAFVAHASEVARGTPEERALFAAQVAALVDQLDRFGRGGLLAAVTVGAAVLANAVGDADDDLARRLAEDAMAFARDELG
jgi:hypothetical protein